MSMTETKKKITDACLVLFPDEQPDNTTLYFLVSKLKKVMRYEDSCMLLVEHVKHEFRLRAYARHHA